MGLLIMMRHCRRFLLILLGIPLVACALQADLPPTDKSLCIRSGADSEREGGSDLKYREIRASRSAALQRIKAPDEALL